MKTLGIDASTQSCSALVIDTDSGEITAEANVQFGNHLPKYGAPNGFIPDGQGGEVHADPRMWLDALELLFIELGQSCELSEITAISGAAQQHGSVYLNNFWPRALKQLTPEYALAEQIAPCLSRATAPIWMDTATGKECREITNKLGGPEAVCARSGSVATERFTGPQIRRFYITEPEAYSATGRIHLVSSFLASVLCGTDAPLDTGDAAGMNLLNIQHLDWDPALLDATAPGLRAKLPQVVPGPTTIGTLAPFFMRKFGFRADTPVTVFTGDNPSSLIGMGASRPGKVVVSLGTSDTFFAAMPGVVADPQGYGHVFGNPAGGCMALQCFLNGSLAREAARDKFGLDWDGFTAALLETPPGNHQNRMLPFFEPEISPRIELPAPFLRGAPEFENWQQPAGAIRACVEGQFLNMRSRTQWMGLQPEVIYLTGGASGNNAIAQVVADIFQAQVCRLAISGSVALGGALRAAHNSHGLKLSELEAKFCRPVPNAGIQPQNTPGAYDDWPDFYESAIG